MAIAFIGTPVVTGSGTSTVTTMNANLASTTVGALNVIAVSANTTTTAGDPAQTLPAGWTPVPGGSSGKTGSPWHRLSLFYRFFQAGDPSTVTVTIAFTGNIECAAVAYSGVDTTTPFVAGEVKAAAQPSSTTTWSTGTIVTAGLRWIISVFGNRTSGTWSALTDTQRLTGITASSANLAYEDTNGTVAAGTIATRTATFSTATSVGNTVIVALNPAASSVAYTGTPADNVGVTDSVSTETSYAPTATDNVGVTDTVSVTAGYSPTVTDAVGITDSASAVLTIGSVPYSSAPADSVGISDSVTANLFAGALVPTLLGEQSGAIAAATGGTATVPATTAGATLLFNVQRSGGAGTGALTGVTDSAGNSWALLTRGSVAGQSNTRNELWVCYNARSVTTVTFTSATSQSSTWKLSQWSGVDTVVGLDTASPDNSSAASSITISSPAVTLKAGDLAYASAHFTLTTAPLSSAGWTALANFDDGAGSGRAAYQVVPSDGSYAATWSPLGVARQAGVLTVGLLAAAGSNGSSSSATPSDAVGITDAVTPVLIIGAVDYSGPVSDNVGITDAASASLTSAYTGAPSEAVGITDSASGVITAAVIAYTGSPADNVGITDSASAVKVTPVQSWLAQTGRLYVAHRGGDNDWPEMTMYAYSQAFPVNPNLALNVDGWQTSDGVWVASHDQNTSRVFGTSMDIPTSTWAQLSGLTTTVGGYPICRVQDVLAAYAGSRVIFAENKHASSLDSSWFALLNTYGGPSNIIVKQYYTASAVATDAHAAGFTTWGYYYAADLANLATTQSRWDILGLDYTDTASADWTTIKSYGKKVLGHVIPSAAAATQAFNEGADGIMTGKIVGVVPGGAIGDAVGITDATSVVKTVARTIADAIGLTDTASAVLDRVTSQADPVGITDSVAAAISYNATVADSIGITEAVTTSASITVTVTDTVGLTDTASPAATASGSSSTADPLGITDAVSTAAQVSRAPADSVGLTDALSASAQLNRALADTLGITDSVSASLQAGNSLADPVGVTDSASVVLQTSRAQADAVGLTDAVNTAMIVLRTTSEPVGITDTVSAVLTRGGAAVVTRTVAEIVAIHDTVSYVLLHHIVDVAQANPLIGGQSFDYAVPSPGIGRQTAANPLVGGQAASYDAQAPQAVDHAPSNQLIGGQGFSYGV